MEEPMKRPQTLRGGLGAAVMIAALFVAPAVFGAAPGTVYLQAQLLKVDGSPVTDGSYDVQFAIYAAQSGGQATWQEGPVKVAVSGGRFARAIGSTKAIGAATMATLGKAWLGIKVANDPELPRARLHAAPYALRAAVADNLSCIGCVTLSEMKFDADLDLGSHALVAGQLNTPQVSATTVKGITMIGDGSKLTGINTLSGSCPKGQAVAGVAQDGKLQCITSAVALPPDGVDNVSNGLVSNEFKNVFASAKPVPIADNNPVGTSDTIDVPDVGIAKKLTVSINVSNSDLKYLSVTLYDAANVAYKLHDKNASGGSLVATYPTPKATMTGDLTKWHGKNPKGKWHLQVTDSKFKNNTTDGAINTWSVNVDTVSNKKVQVVGKAFIDGDLNVDGVLMVGANNNACTAALKGKMRYQSSLMQWCDGTTWRPFAGRGAMYRWTTWSTYDQSHGTWYAGNNSSLFGGLAPSTWGDSNGRAYQLSSTSDVLRAFFVRRGPDLGSAKNANVYSDEYRTWSSTNSRHVAVLFRVRNSTAKNLTWKVYWYRTAYGGWGERASIAVNGANTWDSGGSGYGANSGSSHNLTIPANRTSTVIFVAGSSPYHHQTSQSYARSCFLAFYNNSLSLPSGLSFVDDLATKPNGWNK